MAYSERGEGIGGDLEAAFIDPVEELPEHAFARLFARDIDIFQLNGLCTRLRLIIQNDRCDRVIC